VESFAPASSSEVVIVYLGGVAFKYVGGKLVDVVSERLRKIPSVRSNLDALSDRDEILLVQENLGKVKTKAQRRARDFESGTTGAFTDLETGSRVVPALRFRNPNRNGRDIVKFDGFEILEDGTVDLIDRKTRIFSFETKKGRFIPPEVVRGLQNKSRALTQNHNSGIRGVLEFPDDTSVNDARSILRELKISNLVVRKQSK